MTEREKAITVERLRADQTGIENKTFKKDQVYEALTDPKTWLMFFFNVFVSIPNGGLTSKSSGRTWCLQQCEWLTILIVQTSKLLSSRVLATTLAPPSS